MRSVYLVAHRANDPEDIAAAISRGANAVECDCRRNVVDHDGSFPWSTNLSRWLAAAASAALRHPNFSLIYVDVKDVESIQTIADKFRNIIPSDLNILYNIADFSDRENLRNIAGSLLPNEGLCIDEHDNPSEVNEFFSNIRVSRGWYGNGVFVAGPPWELPVIESSIRRGIGIRNSGGSIKKVAVWTLARPESMRRFIDIGVDAILVNPDSLRTLADIVASNDTVRPAARTDSAF